MFGFLKQKMLGVIIAQVLDTIVTRQNYEELMDEVLDFLERLAAKTSNDLDDLAVEKLRQILQIPDDED